MPEEPSNELSPEEFEAQEKKSFRFKVGVTIFILGIGIGAVVLASLMRTIVFTPQ